MPTKRKAWFRAPDDLGHANLEDKHLASIWRLCSMMNTRWARGRLTADEASWIDLSRGQMLHVTRCRQIKKARETLTVLSRICEFSLQSVGDSAQIYWPKYAEYQQYRTLENAESAPAPAPAPSKGISDPSDPRPAGAERHSKPPAVRGKPPTPTERARAVWPRLVEAARRYGGDPWPEKLGKGNLSILRARIGDGLSEDDLEAVIHGAIKRWGPANSETGWDPLTQLVPQTIYRPTKYEAHLQAGRGGRQSCVELELEKIRKARARSADTQARKDATL